MGLHPAFLGCVGILTVVAVVILRQSLGSRFTDALAEHWDRFILEVPGFGPAIKTANAIRLLRGLSALLEAGSTLTFGLNNLLPTLDNRVLRGRLKQCIQGIAEGQIPSECLATHQALPALAIGLFAIGEEEGSLDQSCRHAADIMEDDLNSTLDTLISLLEPAALLFMGLVVGFVILSTALPTVQLLQNVQTGLDCKRRTGGCLTRKSRRFPEQLREVRL